MGGSPSSTFSVTTCLLPNPLEQRVCLAQASSTRSQTSFIRFISVLMPQRCTKLNALIFSVRMCSYRTQLHSRKITRHC